MSLTLVIGNKNYSSWSMRPWLALKAANIPFREVCIPLYTTAADKQRILDITKSGMVPALVEGDVTVWDSLAMNEYLAERFPDANLWPKERVARAHARSISAEMHSGFMPLRNECGMNIHRPVAAKKLSDDAKANIARVQPDVIAAGNIGCLGQIASGTRTPVVHTVELLDWATGGPKPPGLAA